MSLSLAALQTAAGAAAGALDWQVLADTDSTMSAAQRRLAAGFLPPLVVFADSQSAGRGRMGRPWISPPAAHLYLTLAWHFDAAPQALAGLAPCIGIALVRALRHCGLTAQLKWPNDILLAGAKLGGILIELKAQREGSIALIGVGLNHAMPATAAQAIDQPWTDLASHLDPLPSREQVGGAVVAAMVERLDAFARDGFAPLVAEYDAAHALHGQALWLIQGKDKRAAIADGIDPDGALRVRVDGRLQRCVSGEISLRARAVDPPLS